MNKNRLLNNRQTAILSFLESGNQPIAVSELLMMLADKISTVSHMTVVRDLRLLVDLGYVEPQGKGRGVIYQLSPSYLLVKPVDVEAYFEIDPDKRKIKKNFNFDIFALLKNVFDKQELLDLEKQNKTYTKKVAKLSPEALKREYERLTIELSWKSSKIEGNTYTLLETEHLLREHVESKGHSKEEAIMILNHKTALDYIRSHVSRFKRLDLRDIEDVHYLLTKDLGIERNLRKRLVHITGTAYEPIDNQFQIKEAIEKMCDLVNAQKNPFDKALAAMLLIAYAQPFEDGNKRTSRIMGNAILMAHGCCPISYRSIDELEYKKAVILFYEQNNLKYFKELFINQFEFAVENYFG